MPTVAHAIIESAVRELCREGELIGRIAAAHAELERLDGPESLPDNLWFRCEELLADIAYGADSVREALQRMSAPDRDRLADRIVRLYREVCQRMPPDA
ncbi:hypothetical protein [Lysobacter xanthus]